MRKILQNWKTKVVGAVLIIYILFANDIKMLTTDYTADDLFSIVNIVIMFIFCIELTIYCLVIDGYLFSFYFWLDLVSIFSFLLDVHWFYDFIIYSAPSGRGENNQAQKVAAFVNSSRGVKVGARATRIIRLLRTIRSLRISNLNKQDEKKIELNISNELTKKKASRFKNRKTFLGTTGDIQNFSTNLYNDTKPEVKTELKNKNNENNNNENNNINNQNIKNETINSLKIEHLYDYPEILKKVSKTKLKRVSDFKESYSKIKSNKLIKHIKDDNTLNRNFKKMKTIVAHNKFAINNEIENTIGDMNLLRKNRQSIRKSIKMMRKFNLPLQFLIEKNSEVSRDKRANDVITKEIININRRSSKKLEPINSIITDESKVGRKLLAKNSKRVIIIILSVLLSIILFDSLFYVDIMSSMDMGIEVFNDFETPYEYYFNLTFDIYVQENTDTSCPIIFAEVGNLTYGNFNNTLFLRECEKIVSIADCSNFNNSYSKNNYENYNDFICEAIFDNRSFTKLTSLLNIIKTIFIFFVIGGGIFFFNKDTSDMVLEPIESMVKKIDEISKNPLNAMQMNERAELAKLIAEEDGKSNKRNFLTKISRVFCLQTDDKTKKPSVSKNIQPLETVVLEDTITKIGALLALGFGDAGCEIISKNMQNNSKGKINPILPGKKVIAIYGFCDIRNFTDTTEVLKEKVMIFVNEIAEIVHEITAEHCGSANKNIGDAFLLVWKFEEEYIIKEENGKTSLKNCRSVNQICDLALVTFIKIIAKIHKSEKLAKYRKISGLNKIIKDYQVKMGFGLHIGWSIEGAIGSNFKIDASYLSPHVNMASKLEEKTKEYGVNLVMSEDFVMYLSDAARNITRVMDVNLTDNGESRYVYTVDLDLSSLKIEEKEKEDNFNLSEVNDKDNLIKHISKKKMEKYKKRIRRRKNYDDAINCTIDVWKNYEETDEDYFTIRKKFNSEFYALYNKGFLCYLNGEWIQAKVLFEKAQHVIGEMQYLKNILDYMRDYNYIMPYDWRGNSGEAGH